MLKLISKLWQKIMFWVFFGNGKSKWDGGHEPIKNNHIGSFFH